MVEKRKCANAGHRIGPRTSIYDRASRSRNVDLGRCLTEQLAAFSTPIAQTRRVMGMRRASEGQGRSAGGGKEKKNGVVECSIRSR